MVAAVGAENVFDGAEDRLRHAVGSGYVDLARLRLGALEDAPDAVLVPADAAALRRAIDACAAAGVAIVPFGGGTSVVGGVEPLRGTHERLVSLDLTALRAVEVDRRSLTARLGAGLRGPEAEAALAGHGLTLGHFPQSFEYATIGGFAATRSAGQASSGYGRFDSLVSSVRLVAPSGDLETLETPHTAAGPALRELVVGSEGVFGVIPDVTVRVRPAPAVRRYEGWMAESFEAGAEIVRALAQGPGLPSVIRVSDEEETASSLALYGPRGIAGRLFGGYLSARAAQRRRADDRRLRGRRGVGRAAAGADGAGAARGRRRLPRPDARAAPGSTAATTAPTCATPCSGWGRWSRRSRPRTPGAAWRSCAPRSAPRSAARSPPAARRRSSGATSRTPIPTAPRSTSPSSPAPAAAPRSSSGGR